jgi:SAM-dependent methyltransferase
MNSQPFRVGAYNVHYEGRYCERVLLGRRLGVADKADHVRELLGEDSMDSVLEVGCGTGAVLAALRERAVGRSRQGVDLADPAKHADLHAADIPMWSYDGHTQPFADRSVDLVLASHVVEHVSEPRRLLAEMSRVAARAIFVEVPCELHLRTTRHELQRMLDIGHINAYTPESFQLLLETADSAPEDLGSLPGGAFLNQWRAEGAAEVAAQAWSAENQQDACQPPLRLPLRRSGAAGARRARWTLSVAFLLPRTRAYVTRRTL